MKKQILFKSFILLFVITTVFGIRATPVQAVACSLMSTSVSPSSGKVGDTVIISGYAQGCESVEVDGTATNGNGPFSVPKTLEGVPATFGIIAYGYCHFQADGTVDPANLYVCGSATVTVAAAPATVTVNNTCGAPTSSWSSSTGNTGSSGSSSFTVNPPSGGQTVTITPGALTSGYAWDPISPSSSQTVSPGGSIGFSLSCHQIQIQPTLSASPNPYTCGGNTTLTWNQVYPNATSCSASWTSSTAVSGSQIVTPSADPQTYDITCYGPNGSSGFTSISVPRIANSCVSPVTVDVKANGSDGPVTVGSGSNATLSWSSSNVSDCHAWWTSSTNTSGSAVVGPLFSNQSYTMWCTPSTGTFIPSDSVTVNISQPTNPPVINISATPTSGTVGVVNPQINWSASGSPTSCTASGDWSGAKASSGSAYQGVLSSVKTYTYTLSCTNAYGTGTGSATVVVSNPVVNGSCGATPTHWNCAAGTSANNAGTGPWSWSCVGSGGGSTASCSESLGGFTYSLSNGGAVSLNRGSTITNTITRSAGTGTQAPVSLSATVLPPDLTIQGFSSQSCTPTCTSTITLSATNNATVGPHTVTVAGSPSSSNGPTSFTVNVAAGTAPVVSCSPSSSSALVGQPVTWSANVSGGTPPYTYVWSGTNVPTAPAPTHSSSNTTDTYSNTYTTTGLKNATVRVTDVASNFGDCTNGGNPGSSIQINFNPTFQEF